MIVSCPNVVKDTNAQIHEPQQAPEFDYDMIKNRI